jgi:hypothetical protein
MNFLPHPNRVARALATEGEAFVRLLTVRLGELRLQILPAAQVDTSLNEELRSSGSNLGHRRHGTWAVHFQRG